MKVILMALAAAGFIGSTSALLAETPVSPAEEEKIKATLEGFGCTGGKIEKEDYGYEVDDVKCKDGQEYEVKLDQNFRLIVMTRD
jgi:Peptidase propeptide and YPEB domain